MDIENKLSKLHAKCIGSPRLNKTSLKTFLRVVLTLTKDDPEKIQHLMKNGLAEMMEDIYQKAVGAVSDGAQGAEALLDEVMDCVNGIGDLGAKEKLVMVQKFATKLLRIILMDLCTFQTKLELLKMLNNLLEGCAAAGRDYLQSCKEVPELLDGLAALLFTIGDYEFQVCIIEALFRFITKADRPKAASKWFNGHLQLYPELMKVRDQYFETDCRAFLNVLNLSSPQRVVSCPCKSVFIGDYELKKPEDPLYTQFLIDFNLGSQRITLFCNQEPTESQEGEEEAWETVSIPNDKIKGFNIEETKNKSIQITLTEPGHQMISFGPRNLTNMMVINFDKRYSVEDWMGVICPDDGKGKAVTQTKVSTAINPVAVDPVNDMTAQSMEPESIPESQYSQHSVAASQKDVQFAHPKDYISSSQNSNKPKQKMSVPCQLMRTPTRITTPKVAEPRPNLSAQNPTPATSSDKPTSRKVKMSVTTVPLCRKAMDPNCSKIVKESPQKAKESGVSTPKTPTKKDKTPKKVKTPLIMVSTQPTNRSGGDNQNKSTNSERSTQQSMASRAEKNAPVHDVSVPLKVGQSEGPILEKKQSKVMEPCNVVKRELEKQMEQIKAAIGTQGDHHEVDDVEIVPESQPNTDDFCDPKQSALEQKKFMLNDLKALLHQNDDDFADYPKRVPKVAESPALSTVTEESCSKYSKSLNTPTNSQKTQLTSIPENEDTVDEDNPTDTLHESESPIISPPAEKTRKRKCSKKDTNDTEDNDGDKENDTEDTSPGRQRSTRSKRRSTRSSQATEEDSDSDCEIKEPKPARSKKKEPKRGYSQTEDNSRVKKESRKSTDKSGGVVEVVMDAQVSSSQGPDMNDTSTTFKKPFEKKTGRPSNSTVSKSKALYNEFGFSSQSDEENSSQKNETAHNSSQDGFSARIARLSGKENVPKVKPKFFKARALERSNSSQSDGSRFDFESDREEKKEGKAKLGKKAKPKKQQKPGMNFTNYMKFQKPRDRASSQSPVVEKRETQTYDFPSPVKKDVKKTKGKTKHKVDVEKKQKVDVEKDEVEIEYPSDRAKKAQRKRDTSTCSDEIEELSHDVQQETKKGRKSQKKKTDDDEEDWQFPTVPSPPVVNDASRCERGKKQKPAISSSELDVTEPDTAKKRKGKKSLLSKSWKEDWELPVDDEATKPADVTDKRKGKKSLLSKSRNAEDEDWELPLDDGATKPADMTDKKKGKKSLLSKSRNAEDKDGELPDYDETTKPADVTDKRKGKKSLLSKSRNAEDEDWELPGADALTKPAEKNMRKQKEKKADEDDLDDWEFPSLPPNEKVKNRNTCRPRSKKKQTDTTSLKPDLGDPVKNSLAKIKKKIEDAAPQDSDVEEVAELSQRSGSDYDLGSIRDDSSNDDEMGGALLHYDSNAEVSTMNFMDTKPKKNTSRIKVKDDDNATVNKPTKDLHNNKKPVANGRKNNGKKARGSDSEENDDDDRCAMDDDLTDLSKVNEKLSNLAKKYNNFMDNKDEVVECRSGSRDRKVAAKGRSRKSVNYIEISESESELATLSSFGPKPSSARRGGRKFSLFRPDAQPLYTPDDQVIKSNHKRKKQNVFTDTTETQSEASWLATTNRKKQKSKPGKTYGQGKKPTKRGKLQPGHSAFYDEEETANKENKLKGKGKKEQKKTQPEKKPRAGKAKRSKSPEYEDSPLFQPTNIPQEVEFTPLQPLVIEDDEPISPKHADVYPKRTPSYSKGKQFKPLEMTATPVTPKPLEMTATPVTPRTAARMQDDEISIEEFRSAPQENDMMDMPCPISPVIIHVRDSDSSQEESEEEEVDDDDSDDSPDVMDGLSGTSRYSHISNIKTPKTQPVRQLKVDLIEEGPELQFEDMSPLDFEMPKSGPSSSTRQRKRGVKRNLPESEDEEEDDDEDDEEEEEEDSSQTSSTNTIEEETKASFYQPRKLFKTDDEGETGMDDVVSSSDSLTMAGNNSLQAIPAVIKSFGAEFQKKYSSRKEKLEHFSKNTLKSAHKQVDKFWNHQQASRQRMVNDFTDEIILDLSELEKDIDNLKNAENKSVEFLKSHLSTLQACRVSQEQRIKNLKRKHLSFDGQQRHLESSLAGEQQNVREILRKELQAMQKKILMQSQKEEMTNVKRTLQMMFQ